MNRSIPNRPLRALAAAGVFVGACALATSARPPAAEPGGSRVHGDARHPLAVDAAAETDPVGPADWAVLLEEVAVLRARVEVLEQNPPSAIPSQER